MTNDKKFVEKWDAPGRQRKLVDARRDAGYKRINLWVHVSKEAELRRVAARLIADFQAD